MHNESKTVCGLPPGGETCFLSRLILIYFDHAVPFPKELFKSRWLVIQCATAAISLLVKTLRADS